MKLAGRLVHIAGSAKPTADEATLQYAHNVVSDLVDSMFVQGARFVVPFPREPFLANKSSGPSLIFDWTVAEAIGRALQTQCNDPGTRFGRPIASVGTSKTDDQVPVHRRELYNMLRERDAVAIEFLESGWSSGAYRRERLAQLGDIMIGISGGEGVEHLALAYSGKGKPVIPLDIALGSSMSDGAGGATRLFHRALTSPADFFRVGDVASGAALLDQTRTRQGATPPSVVAGALLRLVDAIEPPSLFYVRLLNKQCSEFPAVEAFFRKTLDPFVASVGYRSFEMGTDKHEFAWMNQAIFSKLHHSSVVLVDLTALRANCFMELGYALGNRQRVIVTAQEGTKVSFDAQSLDIFFWDPAASVSDQDKALRAHWERNIDRPSLVSPRRAQ